GGSFSSTPQRVTVGTHVFPTRDRALGLMGGVDVAPSKADATVSGTFKEPTYSIYFGLNYMFGLAGQDSPVSFSSNDTFSSAPSKPAASSNKGTIGGYVTNIETGDAVVGAKVQACGGNLLSTDASGLFTSKKIQEGPCAIVITHPDFQPLQDQVNIVAGMDSPYDFGLLQTKPKEPVVETSLTARVTIAAKNKMGKDIEALVYFANDKTRKPLPISELTENVFELEEGQYEFFAKSNGMESPTKYVALKGGEEKYIEFAFGITPKKVTISEDKKRIEISEKVQFEIGKSLLTYNSQKLLEEIARVLRENPNVELIEIAGHTDNVGAGDYNAKLSQARADAVLLHLFKYGVDKSRMRAVGYGEDFPVADNTTEEGKYQNRRVEFRILKRTDDQE
ncbi:MAG: OmpA family protein, partial [Deltaproteobacteria bacterium]|nr:OmpA family protein [Deltaproteobacteria bacterium]